MDHHSLGLGHAVVVVQEGLLPGRAQILDRDLHVELARKVVEYGGCLPPQVSEPVLLCQGEWVLILLSQAAHIFNSEVAVIESASPHCCQVVEHDPSVEPLGGAWHAQGGVGVVLVVGPLQEGGVVRGQVIANTFV